jgi:hypothetical protein
MSFGNEQSPPVVARVSFGSIINKNMKTPMKEKSL